MDMDIFPDRPLDAEPTRAVINHNDFNYKIADAQSQPALSEMSPVVPVDAAPVAALCRPKRHQLDLGTNGQISGERFACPGNKC